MTQSIDFPSALCSLTCVIPQIFLEALKLIPNWTLTCVLPTAPS